MKEIFLILWFGVQEKVGRSPSRVPDQFLYGDGRALYTVNIAASYQGESDEGEDQVAMTQDENGDWLVAELPM